MQQLSAPEDEQRELWNTLEVLMHGRAAPEVRCAQQRLEKMQARLRPCLPAGTQTILTKVVRAAVCASQGGEKRFYWLGEVDNHWRALTAALESERRGPRSGAVDTGPGSDRLAHAGKPARRPAV